MQQNDVVGVGVDIIEVARIKAAIERSPRFVTKVFTQEEIHYCESKPKKELHYAARFAVREAVAKAFGTGLSRGMGLKDISVGHNQYKRPVALLSGKAKEIADELEIVDVHISISHTHEYAVANAVAVTKDGLPQEDDKPDIAKELNDKFKEIKHILSDDDVL